MRLALAQSRRESGRRLLRQLLDLIEKERAAKGKLQFAGTADIGGKRRAEKFLVQKFRLHIAAAEGNQRPRRARRRLMYAVCQTLLARAALALQQHMILPSRHAQRLFT